MSSSPRFPFRLWLLAPVLACLFLIWTSHVRSQRVDYVTGIAEWSVDEPVPDPASATGYAGGVRRLLVPGNNHGSYQWIVQTQQMLARGDWRVRHVDYDNAPQGRESHAPSLYRWWLGAVAGVDHAVSGRSLALAVERAALLADPLFHLLLVVVATFFTARWFGGFSAAWLSIALVALFPFAADFLPGAPDQHGFAVAAVLASVLPLLAGVRARPAAKGGADAASRHAPRLFFAAGAAGGFGLWINVASQIPILVGLAAGAVLAVALTRGPPAPSAPGEAATRWPWRSWAAGGALTSLGAYLLEYFPGDLAFRPEVNHPLYALAWLGAGELLWRWSAGLERGKSTWDRRAVGATLLAAGALGAVPAAILLGGGGSLFIFSDPLGSRLTNLNGVVATNLLAWISREGFSPVVAATVLPWLLIGVALWLLVRRPTTAGQRTLIAVALGPVLVALVLASLQLRWCNQLDAALLALLVAATSGSAGPAVRWGWSVLVGALLLPGILQLLPPMRAEARTALTETDVTGIIERDLAHWLARRTRGEAVVLASPDLTTSLYYHGGLRGLGTLDWENEMGLKAAVRITSATSPDEALALIQQRGVTHIVIPSWDVTLDAYAKIGSSMSGNSFIAALNRWVPLVWLRPLPYHLPKISGFEDQAVTVLEVVEEQDKSTALSRQAEYFVEMGRLDLAGGLRKELQRFPSDLGAMVALAQVESAQGNAAGFAQVFNPLISYLAGGADRALAWDRRVSLLGVLAQGNRLDLAREQVRRCLAEATEARVRTLTTGALFRLLALGRKFNLEIADQRVRELARGLLPPSSRSRLQP